MAAKHHPHQPRTPSKAVPTGGKTAATTAQPSVAETFAIARGPVDPGALPTAATPIGPQSKSEAADAAVPMAARLAELQERLFAQSIKGDRRRILLLLQGMDTSGKDGVIKHVLGSVNPSGVQHAAFKAPSDEERQHDFLWRIDRAVPGPGMLGVFNRSQYEDVLIVRVHSLVDRSVWSRRYAQINAFERRLTAQGVTLIKCFLHISREEQAERLLARLDDPTKYWKYNPADVDERGFWPAYQEAYADALRRCNTVGAPWYAIPSDRKWYRNWAVGALLTETLERLDPQYPPADFDVERERERVKAS